MQAYAAAGITLPRTTFQQVYAGFPVYALAQLPHHLSRTRVTGHHQGTTTGEKVSAATTLF